MAKWFVLHTLDAFEQHPNMIGHRSKQKLKGIKKENEIVYYAKGDKVIVGIFKIVSNMYQLKDDPYPDWDDDYVFKIKPIVKPPKGQFIFIRDMLNKIPLKFLPQGKIGVKFKDKTTIPLPNEDFKKIRRYVEKYKAPPPLFQGTSNDAGLGKEMELKVMRHAPTNEDGVVALFIEFRKDLGFPTIEFIRKGFPDCAALEVDKKTGLRNRKFIEFEFESKGFQIHMEKPEERDIKCDYVVCWEHNLKSCPIKVIELKTRIPEILRGKREKKAISI